MSRKEWEEHTGEHNSDDREEREGAMGGEEGGKAVSEWKKQM